MDYRLGIFGSGITFVNCSITLSVLFTSYSVKNLRRSKLKYLVTQLYYHAGIMEGGGLWFEMLRRAFWVSLMGHCGILEFVDMKGTLDSIL